MRFLCAVVPPFCADMRFCAWPAICAAMTWLNSGVVLQVSNADKFVAELWVVKTLHIHKFNNLATEPFSSHQIKFSHGSAAPAPPRMGCCCVPFPRGPDPRKPCPASATAGSPRQTTSAAAHCPTQAVLGRIAKTLGAMEEASHPGYTPNRCRLAWRRLSAVLEMALQSSTDRRPKSCQQRGSGADFPDGR